MSLILQHKEGDKIYINTSMFIEHGQDDIHGGLAIIKKFEIKNDNPTDPNGVFVTFEGIKGHSYNYYSLLREQDKLKEIFGEQDAFMDPDYSNCSMWEKVEHAKNNPPTKAIADFLRYCEDQAIYDKLGRYGDCYHRLKDWLNVVNS